ncbi:TM2 domain-containing protein [Hyunsoonleella jejuensis]|uniref:TM2 domain-containing protein n=1 Tax=Hyunsoonleella jejuensis TaxID=419940 RepID=A0A1H9FGP4_9FLAO|nr:TM2 domain-containing protein [Hyunsoonleella jejuensis]SEQ37072.1 TM2 domain-containing protein [Hyunsoonleella jejuensis]
MKIKLLLSFLVLMLSYSTCYASFPVKRVKTTPANTEISTNIEPEEIYAPAVAVKAKDKWVAAALWLVLGGFAAHRWYIGSPWYWNVLYIITFGYFIVGHIIDIVQILTDSYPGL